MCLSFVPILLKIVLLKYFWAGFWCLWDMQEWNEKRHSVVCGWITKRDFAKNCLECINDVCNSFFFCMIFIQEKKEHKRTRRAAAKKLRDRHGASLAHPRFLSSFGDFWSFCPSLPPGLGQRSLSKSPMRHLTVLFSWLGSQQTGTLWYFPFIILGTLQLHKRSSLQSRNSGRLYRGNITFKQPDLWGLKSLHFSVWPRVSEDRTKVVLQKITFINNF